MELLYRDDRLLVCVKTAGVLSEDRGDDSAPALLREFGEQIKDIGVGTIVSGVGRGVALDRDQNWAKVERAYRSLTEGTGETYEE